MQRDPRSESQRAGHAGCQGEPRRGRRGLAERSQLRAPRAGCGRASGCRPSLELDPCRDSGQPYPQVSELLAEQSSKRSPASRGARRPRGSSPQPLTCSAKGTLPSIAATADARRSSSRQSRAIASRRPPGRARAEAAGQGGRRVPGRRCATRGWLLRILSRSRWDWTSRSAAWAWAGVCVRGAVRARGDVGVHVCVCVYGRGGCVRAYVREGEGERAWKSARERVRPGVTLQATAEPTRGWSRPD